jgi:hypothetical protein
MLGGAFLDAGTFQVLTSLLPLHCVLVLIGAFPTSAFLDAAHLLQVTAHVLGVRCPIVGASRFRHILCHFEGSL